MTLSREFPDIFDQLSENAIRGLAYFTYVRYGDNAKDISKALSRSKAMFSGKFTVQEINTALEVANTISHMGPDFLKPVTQGGHGGDTIIKMLGSNGRKTNTIGAVHTLNDMNNMGYLTDKSYFEFIETADYFKVGRRTDLKLTRPDGSVLRVEYKGTKNNSPGNPYKQSEFLNDVMIYLDKGEDFVWVLAEGHKLESTALKMKTALDSELLEKAIIREFGKDTAKYNQAYDKVEKMIASLNQFPNEFLRKGAY